jgi:hypothetical protein
LLRLYWCRLYHRSSTSVDIKVTTPLGTSATSSADQFTITPTGALPTVTALSGTSGSTFGGDAIIITGTNFTDVTGVSFGTVGVPASAGSFTVISPTQIRIVTPAVAVGTVDVTVTTTAGRSATSSADQFAFNLSAPTVTALSSASGFATGGESVQITGENLAQVTGVYFGNTPAASFTANADGTITAVSPPSQGGAQGGSSTVDVTVRTAGGTSATSAADQFVFTAAGALPTVTALNNSTGSINGGQTITVTGTNFTDVSAVKFVVPPSGGNPAQSITATSFQVISPTQITVVVPAVGVPPSGGAVITDVKVTTTTGTSATSAADQFTFGLPQPIVTSLSLPSGFSIGGETLTITGLNLTGVTAVSFVVGVPPSGGSAQTITATSITSNPDGSLTVVVPAFVGVPPSGGATADVRVTTSNGTSSTSPVDQFIYTPAGASPTVTSLTSPVVAGLPTVPQGPTTGGGLTTIFGTNFTDVTGVSFGGVPARSFTVVSPTQIDAVAPSIISSPSGGGQVGASIPVDLRVTTPAGTSAASTADLYNYTVPLPKITRLSAASGFASGGDTITIFGSNLDSATAVSFVVGVPPSGGAPQTIPATSFTVNPDGSLNVIVPSVGVPPSGGLGADIRVTTPAGTTGVVSADQFTFTPSGAAPAVTSLSTQSGSTAGGQLVTITGANFTDVTGVSFGGVPAALFMVDSSTSIVALSPVSAAGTVNVTVTNAVGTSPTSSVTQFTSSPIPSGPSTTVIQGGPPPYIVKAWPAGEPGAGSPIVPNGLAYDTIMTSFTPPPPPEIPLLHAVYTFNYSTGSSLTDSGTYVVHQHRVETDNTGTTVSDLTDTINYTYSQVSTPSGYQNTHVTVQSNSVYQTTFTDAYGSGYIWQGTVVDNVVYDDTHSGSTHYYTVDSNGGQTEEWRQTGESKDGAGDHVKNVDQGTSSFRSHLDATVPDGGTVVVNYSNNRDGTLQYVHTDVVPGTDTQETDRLEGFAVSHHDNAGQLTIFTDNTIFATNTVHENGFGNDLFADKKTTDANSFASGGSSAAGGLSGLLDVIKVVDKGRDEYTVSATGHTTIDRTGAITFNDTHNDKDDGVEEVIATDSGVDAVNQTNADGSTIQGSDTFSDTSDDNSDYRDSDVEATSGTDQFASHDDDTDGFGTFDNAKVTITSTAPAGAVTTVTVTDTSSDIGTTQAQDENDDTETLPTNTTGESDSFTFDDATGEQDTARDNETIAVAVEGNVLPGDFVDSTETITLGGKETTTDNTDDPGTENDTPTGDGEQDKFTDHSHADANLNLEDILVSREKKTQANPSDPGLPGTYTESQTVIDFTDAVTAQADDSLADQHGARSGAQAVSFEGQNTPDNEVDTDHETTDDNSSVGDKSADTIQVTSLTITPVTNGQLITTNNSTTFAEDFTGDASENDDTLDDQGPANGPFTSEGETDKTSDDLSDQGFGDTIGGGASMEILKDPVTGVTTNILSGQQGLANFNDQASDDTSDTTKSDAAGNSDTFQEDDRLAASAGDSSQGPLDISIVGSPAPGITADFEATLILGSGDGAQIQGEDDSQAAGSDTGDVKFSTTDLGTAGGKTNTTVTDTVNTDDGHGNTVGVVGTRIDRTALGAMVGDTDKGEDDFTDNPQTSTDAENDTDVATADMGADSKGNDDLTATISTTDATSGMKTTVVVTENGTDHEDAENSGSDADKHSASGLSSTGSDLITGQDDASGLAVDTEHIKVVVTSQGSDSSGSQSTVQETITLDDSGSSNASDDNVLAADGTDTESLDGEAVGNASISDTLTATATSINPTTGVKTVTTDTFTISGNDNEHDQENETDTAGPTGAVSDTGNDSEGGGEEITWNTGHTAVVTNSDGSSAGAPTSVTDSGSDNFTWQDSLGLGTNGQFTQTLTNNESGTDSPSDSASGPRSWSVAQSTTSSGTGRPVAADPPPQSASPSGPTTVSGLGLSKVPNWLSPDSVVSGRVARLLLQADEDLRAGDKFSAKNSMDAARVAYTEAKGITFLDADFKAHQQALQAYSSSSLNPIVLGAKAYRGAIDAGKAVVDFGEAVIELRNDAINGILLTELQSDPAKMRAYVDYVGRVYGSAAAQEVMFNPDLSLIDPWKRADVEYWVDTGAFIFIGEAAGLVGELRLSAGPVASAVAPQAVEEALLFKNGIFEVLSEQEILGTTRSAHRASANLAFLRQLQADPELARQFAKLLGSKDLIKQMQSGKAALLNPSGGVWHHPIENRNVMWLLRRGVHTEPELQPILHPRNSGGFARHFGR